MTNKYPRFLLLAILALGLSLSAGIASAQILPGITAFPDNDAASGRFMSLTRGFSSLGESGTTVSMEIPVISGQASYFVVGIFDGDMRNVGYDSTQSTPATQYYFKDTSSDPNKTPQGYWDPINGSFPAYKVDQARYDVYASPDGIISGSPIATWYSYDMADNDWSMFQVPLSGTALNGAGTRYDYTLVVSWLTSNVAQIQNNFKIQITGNLHLLSNSTYGFIGYNNTDPTPYLFPASSVYTGLWRFILDVDAPLSSLEVWDGDLDYLTDTDDPLTANAVPNTFPIAPTTVSEGAHPGAPADNANVSSPLRVGDPVYISMTSPDSSWTATKTDPSGDKEWERFLVSTSAPANVVVSTIPAGLYPYEIVDLDARNTIFLHTSVPVIAEQGQVGDLVWLDANKNGIQDTGEAGIADVTVELWNADGYLVGTQVTDANGHYLFDSLPMSSYYVKFYLPAGYTWTSTDAGDDTKDSDANPASSSSATAQASGFASIMTEASSDLTHDAGLVKLQTELNLHKAGNKLAANTRTIGFWTNNISKHLYNCCGAQVAKADLISWLRIVYGYHLSSVLGSTDAVYTYPYPVSDTQLMKNANNVLAYSGNDIVKKTKRQLMAAELNWASSTFSLGDIALHEAYIKYVEDTLASTTSSTVLTPIHDMLDKINNAYDSSTGPYISIGSFMIFTITLDAKDVPENSTYQITDKLDKSLQFVSATGSGVYNSTTHSVKWVVTPPAGTSTTTLKLAVRINANAICNNYPEADAANTIYSNWIEFTLGTTQVVEVSVSPSASSSNDIACNTVGCVTPPSCKFHNRASLITLTN